MTAKRILINLTVALLTAFFILLALRAHTAQAGGVVASPCDDAALRSKLAGGGDVTFNCVNITTIPAGGVYVITRTTTIDGGGVITLTGSFGTRLFTVTNGVTLTLRNIILENALSSGEDGGAISSQGTLVLENSTIRNSLTDSAHSGGAIFSTGPLFIRNSNLHDNHAGSAGAVFINFGNARAQVSNSTFQDNMALNPVVGRGAAIWVGAQASLSVVDSRFLSNTARFAGGALYVTQGGTATLSTQNVLSGTEFVNNDGAIGASLIGGAIYSEGALSVAGVRLANNGSHADDGGAIYAAGGTLNVVNSYFDSNLALLRGGAIIQRAATTVITGSTFFGNEATFGGAIDARAGGSLDISASQFRSNRAGSLGGAIATGVDTFVSNSTFSNNRVAATTLGGGAIYKLSVPTATLNLNASVLFGNRSDRDGGALYFAAGAAYLANVTLSGNSALNDGGGIFMTNTVTTNFNNLTITANSADSDNDGAGDGGGIRVFTGTFELRNSIVAGNFDNSPVAKHNDCSGLIMSQGHNLIQDTFGCAIGGAFVEDLYGKDPRLGPLAENGGSTRTHALLPGSPAIDAGSPIPPGSDTVSCAGADQRGVLRPIGPRCDMGAYEAPRWLFLPLIRR